MIQERVKRDLGEAPDIVRRGSRVIQVRVQRESREGPESVRRGSIRSKRVQRESVKGRNRVRRGCRESQTGSKECEETVQRESGDRPKSQESVCRDSGEGQEIFRRGSRYC